MGKFITIKDVAAKAGTSSCTVSYVLSGKKGRYITPEMRKRVEDAVKELNYVKSRNAASLKGASTKLIAIVVPQFDNQFFTRVVSFAESVLVENGYDIIIFNTADDHEREMDILNRALQLRVSGVIITPTDKGDEALAYLDSVDLPYVVADRKTNYSYIRASVLTDNYRGGELAANRLIGCGHRKIGYIGWDSGVPCLDDRLEAILSVYKGKGEVAVEKDAMDFADGYAATERLLKKHPDITGLIYGFNLQAGGGVKYLRENNIAIPDELSVIVIGTPQWSYIGNDFDRIWLGEREIGRKSAMLLLSLINGEAEKDVHLVQDCRLDIGKTVKTF